MAKYVAPDFSIDMIYNTNGTTTIADPSNNLEVDFGDLIGGGKGGDD